MKQYRKSDIENARQFFINESYPEVAADVGGRSIRFFVLPQTLAEHLPDFVYRCTGKPEDGYVIGVADSVPEELRPYSAVHEYIEFVEIGIGTKGRCVSALEQELGLVPDELKARHVRLRLDFFSRLVTHAKRNPAEYTPQDIQEFTASLERLMEV